MYTKKCIPVAVLDDKMKTGRNPVMINRERIATERKQIIKQHKYSGYYTLGSTDMVFNEDLPRPGIRAPDLPALSPKVLSIRPPPW